MRRRCASFAISLRSCPVSAAMPNPPAPRFASTSSEVWPASAISKSCTSAAPHEINEERAQASLHNVSADAPKNRAARFFRAMNGGEQLTQIARGEHVRQCTEEIRNCARADRKGFCEFPHGDFALATG